MVDHSELILEMQQIEKLQVADRIAIAKRRRKQQLASYAKWSKSEGEKRNKRGKNTKGIRFAADIELLDIAARATADKGAVDEMRTLLKTGIDPNDTNHEGLTALHQACIDGSLDMVTLLLKAGANVNATDRDMWTPLHAAATCGHLKIVSTLIKAGANLIAVNGDGDIPVDITEDEMTLYYLEKEMTNRGITADAIAKTKEEPHEWMLQDIAGILECGGDINQPLDQGGTFLHTAIANGYNDVVELLIKNNASVILRDKDGWEPVHVASYWSNESALESLVETNQVNLRAKTNDGETPYDLCDDPDIKIQILRLINDRPEVYKFSDDAEVSGNIETSTDDDLAEQDIIKNHHSRMDDNESYKTRSNESINEEHQSYESNFGTENIDLNPESIEQDTVEDVPTNPLLNLNATEFSERRNSVKEAKHMAPMKRQSSTESHDVSNSFTKRSEFENLEENTSHIGVKSNDRNCISSYDISYNNPHNKGNNTSHDITYSQIPSKSSHKISQEKTHDVPREMPYSDQNGNIASTGDKNPKQGGMVYLPRKKTPAPPPPPEGSLLHLKRNRQEARHIHFDSDILSVPPRPRSTTHPPLTQPRSPANLPLPQQESHYYFRMVEEEGARKDPFIIEKKCAIM